MIRACVSSFLATNDVDGSSIDRAQPSPYRSLNGQERVKVHVRSKGVLHMTQRTRPDSVRQGRNQRVVRRIARNVLVMPRVCIVHSEHDIDHL